MEKKSQNETWSTHVRSIAIWPYDSGMLAALWKIKFASPGDVSNFSPCR